MQNSKFFRNNANTQWESERRGAKRSEVILSHGIQKIENARNYHLTSMTKEQKLLQKDLVRIQQAAIKKTENSKTPKKRSTFQTVSARNQPGGFPKGSVMASSSRMTLEMRINDFMDGVSNNKTLSSQKNTAESSDLGASVNDSKILCTRRLSISSVNEQTKLMHPKSIANFTNTVDKTLPSTAKTSTEESTLQQVTVNPQYLRQRRSSLFRESQLFDEEVYAPDGGLRSCHTMPDLMESLENAKHARYIRHKLKPESEKELTIGEIFKGDANNNATGL